MLGRGGRDGSQAAFVSLVWVGQAGRLPLHAKFFVSFQSLQVIRSKTIILEETNERLERTTMNITQTKVKPSYEDISS